MSAQTKHLAFKAQVHGVFSLKLEVLKEHTVPVAANFQAPPAAALQAEASTFPDFSVQKVTARLKQQLLISPWYQVF